MTYNQAREELRACGQPESYAKAYAAQVNWNRAFLKLLARDGNIPIPPAPDYSTPAKVSALARQGGTHAPKLKPIDENSHRWKYLLGLAYPNRTTRKRVYAAIARAKGSNYAQA